jgi:hypothetical protein
VILSESMSGPSSMDGIAEIIEMHFNFDLMTLGTSQSSERSLQLRSTAYFVGAFAVADARGGDTVSVETDAIGGAGRSSHGWRCHDEHRSMLCVLPGLSQESGGYSAELYKIVKRREYYTIS